MTQAPTPRIRVANDRIAAILLAAGSSSRMDGVDKIWAEIAGEPLIARSLRTLARVEGVEVVVVVGRPGRDAAVRELVAELGTDAPIEVRYTQGGTRRQDSVAAGLATAPDADWYLVHDAARPLASAALCARVVGAARLHGAAIPVVPVTDTIKQVDEHGFVVRSLERDWLRAVQTPQVFGAALLRRAHSEVRQDVTDDASMVEALGEPVATVVGEPTNVKVTTPGDLDLVRLWLATGEGLG